LADDGQKQRELDISRDMARTCRWLLERVATMKLQDAERSGAPATFSMEQVVELFALAIMSPVITDELSAIGQKENWRMRWSSSASWRVSPHVMWDDYFKRRNSNHTRSVTG